MAMTVHAELLKQLREMAQGWRPHRFGHGPHMAITVLRSLVQSGAVSAETAYAQADELAATVGDYPTLTVWTADGIIMAWGPDSMIPTEHLILS